MGGRQSVFLLDAWQLRQYLPIVSDDLLAELAEVSRRPRLRSRIQPDEVEILLHELRLFGELITPKTTPPFCRDPKDNPVLAAAIDGNAHAIVSGDADLRADNALRAAMSRYGIEIWGIETLRIRLGHSNSG
jgi:putative PIN family toxin of toxin-antitoxin system